MLGSGRPFLVEIQNARHIPSEMIINEMESKINSSENKLVTYCSCCVASSIGLNNCELHTNQIVMQVGVRNLKVVGSEGWAFVQEGEAEKQVFL